MKGLVRQSTKHSATQFFNLDNGAGTTVDEPLFNSGTKGARILRVYAVYGEATQTVASANFKLGSAAGGAQFVAATAYVNSKAVGDVTEATLVTDVIAPNTTVFVRHTGVAVTQTGTASIVIDWVENE